MRKIYFASAVLLTLICSDANAIAVKNYDKRSYILEVNDGKKIEKIKVHANGYLNLGDVNQRLKIKLLEREVMATGGEKVNIKNRKIRKDGVTAKKEGQDLFKLN